MHPSASPNNDCSLRHYRSFGVVCSNDGNRQVRPYRAAIRRALGFTADDLDNLLGCSPRHVHTLGLRTAPTPCADLSEGVKLERAGGLVFRTRQRRTAALVGRQRLDERCSPYAGRASAGLGARRSHEDREMLHDAFFESYWRYLEVTRRPLG